MLCRCKEFVRRDEEEEEEDEEGIGSSTVSVLAVKYLPPFVPLMPQKGKNIEM